MVAHGDLDAQYFRNEIQVIAHATRERRRRIGIVARVHPSRNAFGLKSANLAEQIGHGAARAIGTRHAHHAGGAAGDQLGQNQFRRTRLGAAFAAAARDVDVLINKARRENQPFGVDRFEFGQCCRQVLADGNNLFADGQNVANAEVFRRINVRTFDKQCHLFLS